MSTDMQQAPRGSRPLVALVEQALGASPADCGYFNVATAGFEPRQAELLAATRCIGEKARQGAAAWLRVYLQGFDSEVAYGLMVGVDGRVRRFSYDSDPSGGSGAPSRFDERICQKPQVTETDLVCDGDR